MRLADAAERRLEEFDLGWNPLLTDEGVDYLSERCDVVREVRLDGLPRLGAAALMGSVGSGGLAPRHAPRLRLASLAHCSGLGDEPVEALLEHMHDAANDPRQALARARDPAAFRARHAPRLTSLDLSFLPLLTDEALRPLVDLSDLGTWAVGDLEMGRKRAQPFPHIKEVRLCGCPQVRGPASELMTPPPPQTRENEHMGHLWEIC
jgi:hypothetical protein